MPNIYAGVAGIALIEETGVAAIEAARRRADDAPDRRLDELGATRRHPARARARGPLVASARPTSHALVAALAAERIVCSARDSNLRISPHRYNADEDIDSLLEALARHRHLLA